MRTAPPKTLHVTNAYHATSGGVRTFYLALLQYANQHARPMRLVAPAETSHVETIGAHGLIYHVKASPSPFGDKRYRLLWPLGASGREICGILRHEQPDLLETSDKYTLPLLSGLLRRGWIRGLSRPVLAATNHERLDDALSAYLGIPLLWHPAARLYMNAYYFPMFDWHISNSEYTSRELDPASKGHRLYREMRVLPMGVNAEAFSPDLRTPEARAVLAARAGVPVSSKLLLYVGRLSAEKNLPLLAQALERLPSDYFLITAGAGDLSDWLKRQSSRVRLLGYVQREDVPGLYAGADAFLHANAREPFGIAPLQAMAAGLPLIAPDQGGVLSYATPHNAWLAPPEPAAFAAAAVSVFNDIPQRQKKTAAARLTAVEHDWGRIAGRYFALYDEMIERGEWRRS